MKGTRSYFVVVLVLVHSVCAYQGNVQLLNVTKLEINEFVSTDQENGGVMMSDKDICLLNGKGLKREPYIKGVLLELGHCMTYNEDIDTLALDKCPYFDIGGHDVITVLYNIVTSLNIKIPGNLSELNDFMCGQLNRTGFLCKDCIDGFGVSYTSLDYQCCNCSNVWYGIPLYLMIEFVPATIFYLIILISNVRVTSAPLTCLVMCVQLFTVDTVSDRSHPLQLIIPVIKHRRTFDVALGFFGIWNLDYFRYVLPPFCISSKLNLRHFILLQYLSAFYPFCLILLTWIFVKLYERGVMCRGCFCALKSRCFGRLSRHLSIRNGVINCFATFFLLSYTKLMHQSVLLLHCSVVYSLNNGQIIKE